MPSLARCQCELETFAARCVSDDACDLACCRACAVTREPMPQRYHNNVYHQAELAYSIIEAELTRPASAQAVPLHSIYWRLPLMNWTAAMLQLLLPSVRVVVGPALASASIPPDCAVIKGSPSAGAYFRKAESASVLRHAAHARCGLDHRRASQACCRHPVEPPSHPRTSHLAPSTNHQPRPSTPQPPRNALVMPRAGAGLQPGSWRNFAAQPDLEATLRSALAPHGGAVRVVPTPGGATPLCEQVALWAEADQILTPNGAHFVNAIFMREGATLLEGVPWAMRNYTGQLAVTRRTACAHAHAHARAHARAHAHAHARACTCTLHVGTRACATCGSTRSARRQRATTRTHSAACSRGVRRRAQPSRTASTASETTP